MIAPAIMAPAVISFRMTRYAPTPSIATWRQNRTTFAAAEILPEASVADAIRRWPCSPISRHRRIRSGIMPIAAMASALRIAASAAFRERASSPFASVSFLRVARSFNTAHTNSTAAPPAAIQPSTGWMRKTMARNTGTQGASKSGMIAVLPR